jgi:hypothetical protein
MAVILSEAFYSGAEGPAFFEMAVILSEAFYSGAEGPAFFEMAVILSEAFYSGAEGPALFSLGAPTVQFLLSHKTFKHRGSIPSRGEPRGSP